MPVGIAAATVRFDSKPQILVDGQEKQVGKITVGDRTFRGVDLGNGTYARLSRRSEGKYDVKLFRIGGGDLSDMKLKVDGGGFRRLRDADGKAYTKTDGQIFRRSGGKETRLSSRMLEDFKKTVEASRVKTDDPVHGLCGVGGKKIEPISARRLEQFKETVEKSSTRGTPSPQPESIAKLPPPLNLADFPQSELISAEELSKLPLPPISTAPQGKENASLRKFLGDLDMKVTKKVNGEDEVTRQYTSAFDSIFSAVNAGGSTVQGQGTSPLAKSMSEAVQHGVAIQGKMAALGNRASGLEDRTQATSWSNATINALKIYQSSHGAEGNKDIRSRLSSLYIGDGLTPGRVAEMLAGESYMMMGQISGRLPLMIKELVKLAASSEGDLNKLKGVARELANQVPAYTEKFSVLGEIFTDRGYLANVPSEMREATENYGKALLDLAQQFKDPNGLIQGALSFARSAVAAPEESLVLLKNAYHDSLAP